MNRREFLRSAGLLATLPGLFPLVSAGTPYTDETIARLFARMKAEITPVDDYYYAIIHPKNLISIYEYEARLCWKLAYRRYRVARQEGLCGYLPAREILERFSALKDRVLPRPTGEIGRYEGVRFITSERIT